MPLPVVNPDTYDSLANSPLNYEDLILRIAAENPEIVRLMKVLEKQQRREALVGVITVYRMLQSQADADDLKDLFA